MPWPVADFYGKFFEIHTFLTPKLHWERAKWPPSPIMNFTLLKDDEGRDTTHDFHFLSHEWWAMTSRLSTIFLQTKSMEYDVVFGPSFIVILSQQEWQKHVFFPVENKTKGDVLASFCISNVFKRFFTRDARCFCELDHRQARAIL